MFEYHVHDCMIYPMWLYNTLLKFERHYTTSFGYSYMLVGNLTLKYNKLIIKSKLWLIKEHEKIKNISKD